MRDALVLDRLDERGRIDLAEEHTAARPAYMPAIAQPPPPMWNSGMATRFTASRSELHHVAGTSAGPRTVVVGEHARPSAGRSCPTSRAGRRRRREPAARAGIGRRRAGRATTRTTRAVVAVADDDDLLDRRQVAGDLVEDRHELLADDEHLGLRVVDDVGDLGRGQPPVDRREHGVQQGGAELAARSTRGSSCRGTRPGPGCRRPRRPSAGGHLAAPARRARRR